MTIVVISLLVVGVVLLIISFFLNDKYSALEEQIEQLTMTATQDTYQLNKKIKILEEELLTDEPIISNHASKTEEKPLLIQKIYHLNLQGYSVEDIASRTNLTENDVRSIIKNSK